MRTRKQSARRSGTVVVWLLVCLLAIIGILALNLDGGRLMEERRRVQAASDAAALAAAKACVDASTAGLGATMMTAAQAAAVSAAAENGVPIDGTGRKLTFNSPPTAGDYAGKSGYVEITIESRLKASFGRIFTQSDLVVKGRAVARYTAIGILCLDPSAAAAFDLSGNAIVNVPDASIYVDSNSASAIQTIGNAVVGAGSINVVGEGQFAVSPQGTVKINAPYTEDPLSALPPPNVASSSQQSSSAMTIIDQTITLQPGRYIGGIAIDGNSNVTMQSGVYIMDGGGFKVEGNGKLKGDGVMIYNTSVTRPAGQILLSGNGEITLTCPTSGVYSGISVFQDRNLTQEIIISGNGLLAISGTLYSANGPINISGNGATSSLGSIICDTLDVSGNGTITLRVPTATSPQNALIRLVE